MSILDALKTQTNSLDDLAALPQAMIMQMAQKGQIREDMLAPILGRKAEMAEATARARALQSQGGQKSTVMEQLMQANAQAEAPAMDPREMGIAQLPVRDDMYSEERMAGGGIIAFERGGDVQEMTDEERAEYIKNNPYLQRSQSFARAPAAFTDFIKEYNPFTGSKFREGVSELFSGDGMSTYEKGRKARTGEIPMFVGDTPTEKGKMVAEGRMTPAQNLQEVKNAERRQTIKDQDFADFDIATANLEKERAAQLMAAKKRDNTGNVTGKKDSKVAEGPKEDGFSKYEKMLMEAGESSKEARNDARNMRLLEAGLNIMGGESPYAFANIGKGAASAAKGYGEDVREFRKEERGRIKDLMEIQKERSDADYKAKMLRVQEIAANKPTSISELANLYRTDPELARLVQGQGKAGMMTFEEAYKIIANDIKNASLPDTEKVAKARALMAAASGGGNTSAAAIPTYDPITKTFK